MVDSVYLIGFIFVSAATVFKYWRFQALHIHNYTIFFETITIVLSILHTYLCCCCIFCLCFSAFCLVQNDFYIIAWSILKVRRLCIFKVYICFPSFLFIPRYLVMELYGISLLSFNCMGAPFRYFRLWLHVIF